MLKIPRLELHISVSTIGCAAKDCVRVILPGEVVVRRHVEGTACSEPLCAVHAAEAVEDAKLAARMFLHREEQRLRMSKLAAGQPADIG